MTDILDRLANLQGNLIKSGKPNAAKVCRDAAHEIVRLREKSKSPRETSMESMLKKAGFM